ncbi:J domain-containing protein [Vibrio sp. RE86]|uniref:J domain-containing protein n=1 Tax=Vibrio sp. RE86 TaxID=2607605 RepID=UPI0014934E84|nr:J domain-containing protein [Vibrio sp. RE86]NOH79609.1 J domain-containing protein [Vibrio sp. RE86]
MRILFLFFLFSSTIASAQSIEELTQSAQNNNTHAQVELANRYFEGNQIEQSYPEALYWFEQAATSGSESAAVQLGKMYIKGLGTKTDNEHAIFWLSKAAHAGNTQASLLLGQLYESLSEKPDNLEFAELWYQAASQKDPEAEEAYARILEQQFNAQRAKQVATIDQLEVAFNSNEIELSPKARSIEQSQRATHYPLYGALAVLVLSMVIIAWQLKANRALRSSQNSADSDSKRQLVKLERELKRREQTLKQQKRQLETMYKHIKKLQAAPKPTTKSSMPNKSEKEKPLTVACAIFGYTPTTIPNEKQIKVRYKQLCKIYHPDLKGSHDEMKRLNQALKIIIKEVNK